MPMSMQEVSDRLEIQDLMVRYSYAIDSRNWDALDDVFTPDAHIDYSVFGGSVGNLEETKKFLEEAMPMFSTLWISKPARSRLLHTKLRGIEASAPGNTYFDMNRPQVKSSGVQLRRSPAICRTWSACCVCCSAGLLRRSSPLMSSPRPALALSPAVAVAAHPDVTPDRPPADASAATDPAEIGAGVDRASGEMLDAQAFAPANATSGIDLKTGALRRDPAKAPRENVVLRDICPGWPGAAHSGPAPGQPGG